MTEGPITSRIVPRLDSGLTILDRPRREPLALHRLVLAELGERDGRTFWVDARNEASTYALYDLASRSTRLGSGERTARSRATSHRQFDGVRVARAFTAYQHHSLVRALVCEADDPALVVAPCIDSLYRDDDLSDREARDLFESSLTVLREVARTFDVPVLTTGSGDRSDATADLLAAYADAEIECTRTDAGLKYATDGFETTVYLDDGYWQTTIPYWVELFGAVADAGPAIAARAAGLADVEV